MSALSLHLQSFDPEEPAAQSPSEDYLAGYAEGFERGLAEARADQDHLRGELIQAISDLEFPFSEARRAVLEALAPLFQAILDGLTPELAGEALRTTLVGRLVGAAQHDSARCITIHAAPQEAHAIETALAQLERAPFRILADPVLRPGEAIWSTDAGETALDFAAVLAQAREALAALVAPHPMEMARHG